MTSLDEILTLRQSPSAFLLLAYCREVSQDNWFRFRPFKTARALGRTPRTLRAAMSILVDRGLVIKTEHRQMYEFGSVSRETKQAKMARSTTLHSSDERGSDYAIGVVASDAHHHK